MEATNHKLMDGEKFCWTTKEHDYSNQLVIHVDTCGNVNDNIRPSLYYSAKQFLDYRVFHECRYFKSIKSFKTYDISNLSCDELKKLFEEEAR